MNAAERLEAAIEKLEALKAGSTPGKWEVEEAGVGFTFGIRDHYAAGYVALDRDMRDRDAELIVTLHRTIDAQVQVLRAAEYINGLHPLNYTNTAVVAGVALADAILGSEA